MGREIEIKIPLTDAEYEKIFKVISGDAKLDGLDVAVDGLEHLLKTDTYFSRYDSREESKGGMKGLQQEGRVFQGPQKAQVEQ